MVYGADIEIKTKYKSINECRANCRDHVRKMVFPMALSNKIYGEIFDDNGFKLSSNNKIATLFKFEGHIESRADGIYMVGKISVKFFYKVILYVVSLFFIITGLLLIIQNGSEVIVFGLILITLGWFYIYILKSSNALYHHLISKLQ